MSIFINGRFLLQPQTGVNRFAFELTRAMVNAGEDITVICPRGNISDDYDVSSFKIQRFGLGRSHFWEQIVLPLFFLFHKGILLSFTGLGPVVLRRKIITIHDLAFYENPLWYSKLYVLFYKLMTPLCAKTSRFILTVSEFSKKEIYLKLGIPLAKIHVLYNAVSSGFLKPVQKKVSENYILAVSTLDPRKNFRRLVESFVGWENNSNIKLYLVGGKNSVFANWEIIENENIKWLGRVSDEELVSLYQNALCFVYPSLYEGFGIPPLEAMASGVPVIVSDIPPLREVCDKAAIYVDPYDIDDMKLAFSSVVSDITLRQSLVENGKERFVQFSWDKSAEKLAEILKL